MNTKYAVECYICGLRIKKQYWNEDQGYCLGCGEWLDVEINAPVEGALPGYDARTGDLTWFSPQTGEEVRRLSKQEWERKWDDIESKRLSRRLSAVCTGDPSE